MELNVHLKKERGEIFYFILNTNKKEGFGFEEGDEIVSCVWWRIDFK